jgi:zinc/manganese transport system permease protein
MIELFTYPFVQYALLASLIIAGIHAYLGFHIVSRGVIFVDISLAQAAAFGGIVAIILGMQEHSMSRYFISLLFTFFGAAIISVARTKDERIPQEAFIGITYAGFSVAALLLLSGQPEGTEELQKMLSGSLLTVTTGDLISTTILYSVIGIFHWLLRKRFFRLSEDRIGAMKDGWSIGWWDFLFYASVGFVVTLSVQIAGVLLVFSLLVIPPVIALLFTRKKGYRLILGWSVSVFASILGIFISVGIDLPAGPAVIASLIFLLLISGTIHWAIGLFKQ